MSQLKHRETAFPLKKFPVALILDNISGPANVGSIFRLADAFNVETLLLCGAEVDLKSNRLLRTARSTVSKVDYEIKENTLQVCREYLAQGYELFALEITQDSTALETIDFAQYSNIAIVVGNENSGIDEQVLRLIQTKIHITMFGENSSMNVAQATGIALYEITKSLHRI